MHNQTHYDKSKESMKHRKLVPNHQQIDHPAKANGKYYPLYFFPVVIIKLSVLSNICKKNVENSGHYFYS